MKTVILLLGIFFCFAASAQQEQRQDVAKTTEVGPDKKTSAKKAGKTKPVAPKISEKVEIINGEEVTSLQHTQEYTAKSAFQIMLEKRLEIDAAAAKKDKQPTKENN